MPRTITVTDVNVQQEMVVYGRGGDVFVRVGYELVTNTGDVIQRAREVQLTGARKTRAVNMFQEIRDDIIAKEGI